MTATPNPQPRPSGEESLPPQLGLAFAPLHKRAFGMALGTAVGLLLFGITLVHLARNGTEAGLPLGLLRVYLAGYSATIPGAFVGLAWGFFIGFIAGWFVAFSRNLVLASSIFILRAKAELRQTQDFLDHI